MNQEISLQSIFESQLGSMSAIGIEAVASSGHGTFTAGSLKFPAGFSILRRLSHASIILEPAELGNHAPVHLLLLPHGVSLLGSLDDGRSIRVEDLHVDHCNESFVEMTPMNCAIEIGQKPASRPLRAKYTLTGLYHGNISFDFQDWKVQICTDSDSIAKARASKALKVPFDGARSSVTTPKGTDVGMRLVPRGVKRGWHQVKQRQVTLPTLTVLRDFGLEFRLLQSSTSSDVRIRVRH